MPLGMIRLRRMGANMVRRLLRAGHECVVDDVHLEPDHLANELPSAMHDEFGGHHEKAAERPGRP